MPRERAWPIFHQARSTRSSLRRWKLLLFSEFYLITVKQKTLARTEGWFLSKDPGAKGRRQGGLGNKAPINFGPDFQVMHVQFFLPGNEDVNWRWQLPLGFPLAIFLTTVGPRSSNAFPREGFNLSFETSHTTCREKRQLFGSRHTNPQPWWTPSSSEQETQEEQGKETGKGQPGAEPGTVQQHLPVGCLSIPSSPNLPLGQARVQPAWGDTGLCCPHSCAVPQLHHRDRITAQHQELIRHVLHHTYSSNPFLPQTTSTLSSLLHPRAYFLNSWFLYILFSSLHNLLFLGETKTSRKHIQCWNPELKTTQMADFPYKYMNSVYINFKNPIKIISFHLYVLSIYIYI